MRCDFVRHPLMEQCMESLTCSNIINNFSATGHLKLENTCFIFSVSNCSTKKQSKTILFSVDFGSKPNLTKTKMFISKLATINTLVNTIEKMLRKEDEAEKVFVIYLPIFDVKVTVV